MWSFSFLELTLRPVLSGRVARAQRGLCRWEEAGATQSHDWCGRRNVSMPHNCTYYTLGCVSLHKGTVFGHSGEKVIPKWPFQLVHIRLRTEAGCWEPRFLRPQLFLPAMGMGAGARWPAEFGCGSPTASAGPPRTFQKEAGVSVRWDFVLNRFIQHSKTNCVWDF